MGLLPEVPRTGISDLKCPEGNSFFLPCKPVPPLGFPISLGAPPSVQMPETNNEPVLRLLSRPGIQLTAKSCQLYSLKSLESVPL